MNVACGTEVRRETEERRGEGGEEIKDVAAAWIFLPKEPPSSPTSFYDGECWKRFDGCLPIITSDLFRHATLPSLEIQHLLARIGIQRRRNCIYDRKFYDSVVDLLVNFGNFGSLDMS